MVTLAMRFRGPKSLEYMQLVSLRRIRPLTIACDSTLDKNKNFQNSIEEQFNVSIYLVECCYPNDPLTIPADCKLDNNRGCII